MFAERLVPDCKAVVLNLFFYVLEGLDNSQNSAIVAVLGSIITGRSPC